MLFGRKKQNNPFCWFDHYVKTRSFLLLGGTTIVGAMAKVVWFVGIAACCTPTVCCGITRSWLLITGIEVAGPLLKAVGETPATVNGAAVAGAAAVPIAMATPVNSNKATGTPTPTPTPTPTATAVFVEEVPETQADSCWSQR